MYGRPKLSELALMGALILGVVIIIALAVRSRTKSGFCHRCGVTPCRCDVAPCHCPICNCRRWRRGHYDGMASGGAAACPRWTSEATAEWQAQAAISGSPVFDRPSANLSDEALLQSMST